MLHFANVVSPSSMPGYTRINEQIERLSIWTDVILIGGSPINGSPIKTLHSGSVTHAPEKLSLKTSSMR